MATLLADNAAPTSAEPGANLSRSHPFTCVTCAIAFRSSKMQRDHMRSDWHRYNLKRRVASLPPLSSEIFAEKVLTAQASSSAAAAKAAFKETCNACQKTYYSENAYQNHLGSQRHRQRAAMLEKTQGIGLDTPSVLSSTISLGEPMAVPGAANGTALGDETGEDPAVEAEFVQMVSGMKDAKISQKEGGNEGGHANSSTPRPVRAPRNEADAEDSDDESDAEVERPGSPAGTNATADTQTSTAMPLERCLFCNYDSPTFKLSILHMSRHHALFIPEQDYLVDLEGLVRYLQAKIVDYHECLFCHKFKGSASGIQTHMRDKGHTMIAFDSEEEMVEIGQFYDFRSTYSDDEEDEDEDEDDSSDEDENEDEDTSMSDSEGHDAKRASKLGAKRPSTKSRTDGDEDEGWETDSSSSDAGSSSPSKKDSSYRQTALARYHRLSSRHAAYSDGHELHLPSGRTAGHRHLARYYRQNLHNYPSAEERLESAQRLLTQGEDESTGTALAAKRRQLQAQQLLARRQGGMPSEERGLVGVSEAQKKQVRALAIKQRQQGQRKEKQYRWGVEKRANNQQYFRDDVFGIRH